MNIPAEMYKFLHLFQTPESFPELNSAWELFSRHKHI